VVILGRLGREEGIAGDHLVDCSHNWADLAEVEESGHIDYIEVVVVDSYCTGAARGRIEAVREGTEAVRESIAEDIVEGIDSCSRTVIHYVVCWQYQLS